MSFARLGPLVLVVAFGCRFPNPAFEDGDSGDTDEFGDGSNGESSGSLGESADGEGESAEGESSSQTSSDSVDGVDTVDSNDSVDGSSSGSTSDGSESSSDGFDTSSDGFDSSSSGSTSDGFDTESDDLMSSSSDGLDAPDLSCPQVFPADDCYSCMNNNCCTELDVGCFDGSDAKCHCTLQCLAEGGDNCAMDCGADPLKVAHATMIFECGQMECANLCV
jgi:hypothetical protein